MFEIQRNDPIKVNNFKYVIIDTDCGGDDAQALVLLDHYVRKYGKTLLGITCCDGNAFIADVIKNVLIVQSICGSSYPIYPGIQSSLAGETIKDNFFGKDGLGETQEHYMKTLKINHDLVQKTKAYKFIADSAIKHKGEIALICIGPLSNLALAYHYNNNIVDCFTNISIMGTSDTLAGLHDFYTAEFNIGLDPEAGHVLFQKFKNIIVCSLDTTVCNIDDSKTTKLFLSNNNAKADFVRKIHQYQFKKPLTPKVCDPLAVMFLFRPELVKQGCYVRFRIIIKGIRTRGCSMIDYFSPDRQNFNAYLIKFVDQEQMFKEIDQSYQ